MLPLFLDMSAKKVVVFGGGEVGFRKASFFSKEAKVVVVSNDFCQGLLDSGIDLVREDAKAVLSRWLDWADLVVAATNDRSLNEHIVIECSERSKLCNSADGVSTFLIPSTVERDSYTIAISTLGRSPAMSKFIRVMLERQFTEEYDLMIGLQEELRTIAKGCIPLQKDRERFLWDILDDEDIWKAVRVGDIESARKLAKARMVSHVGNGTERAHHS